MLYYISRNDFLDIVRKSAKDYEIFCMLRDRLSFSQSTVVLENKCLSCNRYGHYLRRCPLLHYVPDVEKIVLKNNFSKQSIRNFAHMRGLRPNVKVRKGIETSLKIFVYGNLYSLLRLLLLQQSEIIKLNN